MGTYLNVRNLETQNPIEKSSLNEDISFKVGEQVLLRDKMKQQGKSSIFSPKYRGPYVLIGQLSPVTFKIKTNNNKIFDKVHIRRLKEYNSVDKRIIQRPDLSETSEPTVQNDIDCSSSYLPWIQFRMAEMTSKS